MPKYKKKLKSFYKNNKKSSIALYFVLRVIVILTMIISFIRGEYSSVGICLLTLILFLIPLFINDRLNIDIPDTMEIIIFLFIFSAEILGEINNFYVRIPNWDIILHTINGFLCAAIGFSLIDILNNYDRFHLNLTPIFVVLVSICFSMTMGVCWEFIEFGADTIFKSDMQKDSIITNIATVELDESKSNKVVTINNIDKTVIYSTKDGEQIETVIENGYLDIGLLDTMEDLLVNFIGAIVFSVIGYFYIHNRDKYKFAENFIPKKRTKKIVEH